MFRIYKINESPVVDYAAEELKKYLRMMMPDAGEIVIERKLDATEGFRLGLMADFGLDTSEAEDLDLDDIIHIDTDANGGIIAGSNPRSVLFAVYKYLTINGCRWLFPGIDGEFIPVKDVAATKYHKMADMRYRGQCNEGAEYQPNMMEAIEFTPKIGMNVFMLEFVNPHAYYDRYYEHLYNEKNREPEPVTLQTVYQWKRQCEVEIAKRGLQFHDMGHGWATWPFGLDPDKRYEEGETDDALEAARPYLALVKGERKLKDGIPMYTNFCMGPAENRKKVVDKVVDYATKCTNVDYLHVWLGDSLNFACECDVCREKTFSDWYVVLLNEIDAALTAKKLNTRIVFIVYYTSLYSPEVEKLNNPDRFSLIVAPISRSYTEPVSPEPYTKELKKFVLNNNTHPTDPLEPVAHAEDWVKKVGTKSLVYEYHFWVNQCYEVTGLRFAEIIHNDIKGYKAHGFGGTIEDGSQRSFFPNGFAFYTYGLTLFDTALNFEDIKADYFKTAYGDDWREVVAFFEKIQECMDHKFFAGEKTLNAAVGNYYNPPMAEKLRKVPEVIAEFRPFVEAHKNMPYRAQTVSYRLLNYFLEYAEGYSKFMVLKSLGAAKEAKEMCFEFMDSFGRHEVAIERYYDQKNFGGAMNWRILKSVEEPLNLGIY